MEKEPLKLLTFEVVEKEQFGSTIRLIGYRNCLMEKPGSQWMAFFTERI
ncbi:hypothetical protein QF028_003493 [Neobacillus sp. B4I6]